MALTDASVRSAKPGPKPVKLFDGQGLYLLVQPTGGKLWRLKYRFAGKERLLALGSYGDVTLREARQKRDEAREQLRNGQDPSLLRKVEKLTQRAAAENSFETVARAWWNQWKATKSAKHQDEVLRRLERDTFPDLGPLPISSITAAQLLAVSLKIERRGAHDLAKRAYQTAGQICRFAVAHGILQRNPAADVRPSDALKPTRKGNYARLDAKELPELLRKIDSYDGSPYTRSALKLMTLTFVRTSELIASRWEEFDLSVAQWRIPATRMKMQTPHIVPLSRQALEVLAELKGFRTACPLVFPGERDHEKPMSNNTILFALYRMGYHSRMTGHGFRGIASTVLHEHGHEHHLIELQLAHQERNAVSAAYNHATYIAQRTKMMQAWADYLDELRLGAEVLSG
ncbi:tyrosine-type recombinase/integrase [Piscinibacter koreensis]|uniref:Integrase arm-type DNA-binding domain-containing protein n=1 Tax=Piscinibacter koreensis TaxID=2742824 RepID=A0A7Y6TYC7_9BURK|nr:integrase arm-type DNA-binding domain-containing protein [Schlegelella koreensis]NUZ08074.1 integrase arm-type DNA-binding domain-containing protein [Schlegelella koreensis]